MGLAGGDGWPVAAAHGCKAAGIRGAVGSDLRTRRLGLGPGSRGEERVCALPAQERSFEGIERRDGRCGETEISEVGGALRLKRGLDRSNGLCCIAGAEA